MVRTQIQLSEDQAANLKRLAALRGTSMAEIIRQAVDRFTSAPDAGAIAERKKRALAAVGRFRSGRSDVSARHDDYLAEAFK